MILYSLSGLLCCLYVNLGGSARLRTVVVPLQKAQVHRREYLCLFILSQVLFCTLDCQLLVAFNSTNNDFTTLHKHWFSCSYLYSVKKIWNTVRGCSLGHEHTNWIFGNCCISLTTSSPGELLRLKTQWAHCTQFLTVGGMQLCTWVVLIITATLTCLTSHTIHIICHEKCRTTVLGKCFLSCRLSV